MKDGERYEAIGWRRGGWIDVGKDRLGPFVRSEECSCWGAIRIGPDI
jgi:hypothetical protein